MYACVYSPTVTDYASLVNCAYAFSPLVEETDPNTVVLDVEGGELLFGSPREIAKEIQRNAASVGLNVNIAVARNPDAAIHAARSFAGISIIAPGKESKKLGGLPLGALDISLAGVEPDRAMKIFETLVRWGIRSFGELAALPETGVSERLGPEGVRFQKLAKGDGDRPLLLAKPEPGFERSIDLDDPIELLEPLSFIIARLLNQLCANLQAYGLAVDELRVRFRLEDKSEYHRTIRLPFPMRDSIVFLKLLLLDIESHPPQFAVVAVSIACEPARPRSIQNGLFQPLAPEPEKLELTLARLTRLVGENNVGSPELIDTHRPDAFRIKRFIVKREVNRRRRARRGGVGSEKRKNKSVEKKTKSQVEDNGKQGDLRPSVGTSAPLPFRISGSRADSHARGVSLSFLGFRVFRPPLRANVEAPGGWPSRIKASAGVGRTIVGRVLRVAGPWRTSGDWWTEDRWARDEWDVSVGNSGGSQEKGTVYRIYRDLRSDGWFVEGIYD